MSAIPGDIGTEEQPPMAIPLRHFVVGLGCLVGGSAVGVATAAGALPGGRLTHVHLLLAGWVCVTIMGAMTQFVPVWSGTALHSKRLATAQLRLVVAGLVGMAASFLALGLPWVHAFGLLVVLGFWTFVYNVGRTLLPARPWDVTERHFAIALIFFALAPPLGFVLAMGYAMPAFGALPIDRSGTLGAHATLAVFGAILTTVLGALYQLSTMFTQTELHGLDEYLQGFEEGAYPLGVLALAGGRLVGAAPLARVGGVLVALALASFSVILGRRLVETQVEWTPMLSRYAVVAVALALWAVVAAPTLVARPLATASLFGGPGAVHLLFLGIVGFVVLGTLYHVVPFIVWVHRYSDRLGFEPVPMIDDLYDDRIAAADFAAILGGTAALVAAELLGLPIAATAAGGALATVGFCLFAANVLLVVREHGPRSPAGVLVSRLAGDGDATAETGGTTGEVGGDAAR